MASKTALERIALEWCERHEQDIYETIALSVTETLWTWLKSNEKAIEERLTAKEEEAIAQQHKKLVA